MKKNRVYLIATVVTITVILVNQAIIQYWLYQKKEDAMLINVGGRQRMLSQRLLALTLVKQSSPGQVEAATISTLYDQWQTAHNYLLTSLKESVFSSAKEKEIYTQLVALTPYLEGSKAFLMTETPLSFDGIQQFQNNQETFLRQMDHIVSVMEKDSQSKLTFIITIEILFALISLFMIYYEIRFVFQRINDDLVGKNVALKESNQLLEQYAYLAAHDLRSPTQNIINFAKVLRKRLAGRMEPKEEGYFDFIQNAAQRLRQTTDHLLQFSTINDQKIQVEALAPQRLIGDVVEDLKFDIKERGAQINVGELPATIYADQHLLHLVFQNLIANGIKFVPRDSMPIVEVSYREEPGYHTFAIRDNGIGISEENQEKIFGLFKRLHAGEQYEGTGIGLSICQKIIEKHQGEIRVESQEKKGSTFTVSLPKNLHG